MTAKQVLTDLQKLADPRSVKRWAKMGMPTEAYLGINLTKLKAYAKKLKKNHPLALELWATGVHDARLLAALIEDPKAATENQLDTWVNEAEFFDITDQIVHYILPGSSHADKLMLKWLKSKKEFVRRSGWMMIAHWGAKLGGLNDAELSKYMQMIEKRIHAEENFVREAMVWALINIGWRKSLKAKALAVAKRIGKVDVDYGDTSCKIPDALFHISKK